MLSRHRPPSLMSPRSVAGRRRFKNLQPVVGREQRNNPPALDIQVSAEEIRTAGSRPDQWLTYSGSLDGNVTRHWPRSTARMSRDFEFDGFTNSAQPNQQERIDADRRWVGSFSRRSRLPMSLPWMQVRGIRWRYRRSLPDKLPTECGRSEQRPRRFGERLVLGESRWCSESPSMQTPGVYLANCGVQTRRWLHHDRSALIVNESVVVGVAGGEYGIRGFLAAYDAKTGQQQWKFNTIPGPGEFGHDTWKNDAWRTGGGATWVTGVMTHRWTLFIGA